MTPTSTEQQFTHLVDDLTQEFSEAVGSETVLSIVSELRAELEPGATITEYLPVLVRRYAREQLMTRSQRRQLTG